MNKINDRVIILEHRNMVRVGTVVEWDKIQDVQDVYFFESGLTWFIECPDIKKEYESNIQRERALRKMNILGQESVFDFEVDDGSVYEKDIDNSLAYITLDKPLTSFDLGCLAGYIDNIILDLGKYPYSQRWLHVGLVSNIDKNKCDIFVKINNVAIYVPTIE